MKGVPSLKMNDMVAHFFFERGGEDEIVGKEMAEASGVLFKVNE